jgi:signal transduction histidine kinase
MDMTPDASTPVTRTVDVPTALPDRRRKILVDPRYQLRAGMIVGLVAFVLLLLVNLSLMTDGAPWILLLGGSAVLLGGIVLVGVVEAHRTAGAAFAIRRTVDALAAGTLGARVKLRRGDHLQELAQAINRLAEALDAERRASR